MSEDPSDAELEVFYKRLQREPLVPLDRKDEMIRDRSWVMQRLPHRDPLLLVDSVRCLDVDGGVLAGSYDLARAADVFAGHFPEQPIYPGLLQIEAIGQAGILLVLEQWKTAVLGVKLTHVRAARFMRPVLPDGTMEILARVFDDGLLTCIIGQTMQRGEICSVAMLSGMTG